MDLQTIDVAMFAKTHVSQVTATIGLVTFAITKKKLTPGGIAAGILVAFIHMVHPWPAFFWLLTLFFFFGTVVTKVCWVLSCSWSFRAHHCEEPLLSSEREMANVFSKHELQHQAVDNFDALQ